MKILLAAIAMSAAATFPASAACFSVYGCSSSGGIDLRDQSGRPDLYGNRYENDYLRQQQRDAYERQQYERQNRALGSEYDSYGQPRFQRYGY